MIGAIERPKKGGEHMSDIEQEPPAAEETGPTEGEQPAAEEAAAPAEAPAEEAGT
jgi:hypothetical protein